jgi:dienelactone hydrolase
MTHQKELARSDRDLSRQLRTALNFVIILCIAGLSESAIAQNASAISAPVIGEQILHLVDRSRADPIALNHPREWMVTVLYPAQSGGKSAPESYYPDSELTKEILQQTGDEAITREIHQSANRKTAIHPAAPPDPQPHPLLLLSPGYGEVGRFYTYLASALVARGFVVAIVDHPYLGIVRLPDGRVLRAADDPGGSANDPAALALEVAGWSRDLTVVLDRILAASDSGKSARIDSSRIAALGHSSGGTIAIDACHYDRRISVCVDFDGTPDGSKTLTTGPGGPTLFVLSSPVYSDEQLQQRGRTRASQQQREEDVQTQLKSVLAKGTAGPGWIATVKGGGHMSFSDAPEVSPSQLSRFGGTYMSAARSLEVYAGLAETFVRAYFPGGAGSAALQQFQKLTSEVTFTPVPKSNGHPIP